MTTVLDTCALLWWSLKPEELSTPAKKAIAKMEHSQDGMTSAMAIWETAIKVKKQQLDLGIPLNKYIDRLEQSDVVTILDIEVDLLVESVEIDWFHRDPVDRIMVALATQYNAPLITKDKKIKEFYPKTIW